MKKILIVICIFLNGCILDPCGGGYDDVTKYEHKSMHYKFTDTNSYSTNFISLQTPYELPEYRTDDFLETLLLLLATPELKDDISIQFMNNRNSDATFNLYYENNTEITVENNIDFDTNSNDYLDTNYYTDILIYKESWFHIANSVKIYIRFDKTPKTKISYMVMIQPHDTTTYKYLTHTVLSNFIVSENYYEGVPLPEILK